MQEGTRQPGRRVQIASSTKGRIRLRVPRDRHTSTSLALLAEELQSLPGPAEVEVRVRSASIVIGFDPKTTAAVQAHLENLGITGITGSSAPRDPAATIGETAIAVNRAISARMPGGADLRLLIPLTLGLLSARQFVRGDDRLSEAPWYLLAVYAAESFSSFGRRTS